MAALLGAVALGGVIFDFLFWSFGALRMGTAGLTAQASGAGDDREDRPGAGTRQSPVALLIGLVLIALQWPIGLIALQMMGASPEVSARSLCNILHPYLGRALHPGELLRSSAR